MEKIIESTLKNFQTALETQAKINLAMYELGCGFQEKASKQDPKVWETTINEILKKQNEILEMAQTAQEGMAKEHSARMEAALKEFSENQKRVWSDMQEQWKKNFGSFFK